MMEWAADLHCHTDHSFDCQTSPRTLLTAAKAAGLQAIAITDHDAVSALAPAAEIAAKLKIQLIPGVEITTTDGTHIVGLFIDRLPRDRRLEAVIDFIHDQRALAVIPHLYRRDTGLDYNYRAGRISAETYRQALKKADLLEWINFKSQLRGEPLPQAIVEAHPKPLLGTTDAHYPFEIGKSTTVFSLTQARPLTPTDLLKAERRIRYFELPKPTAKTPSRSQFQPSVGFVDSAKRVLSPKLVSWIGRGFYRYQARQRYLEKERRIIALLAGRSPRYFQPRGNGKR